MSVLMTARDGMTEAALQRGLVEAARALGYLVFHATAIPAEGEGAA